jgi:hypothetical protein
VASGVLERVRGVCGGPAAAARTGPDVVQRRVRSAGDDSIVAEAQRQGHFGDRRSSGVR